MKNRHRILAVLLTAALFCATGLTAHASTASIFDGYTVTVLDKATPAVTVYGRTTDRNVMCFMSASGQEVGTISYGDFNQCHHAKVSKSCESSGRRNMGRTAS